MTSAGLGWLSVAASVVATANWLRFSNRKTVEGLTAKRRAAVLVRLEGRQATVVWVVIMAMSAFVVVERVALGRGDWWIWLIATALDLVSLWVRHSAAGRVRGYFAEADARGPVASSR